MGIVNTITYHELVVRDDIPKLDSANKQRVKRVIEERLTAKAEQYSTPLRYPIQGYRKLRVGDYRVVFKIHNAHIFIIAIKHRSTIYREVQKRI